MQIDRNSYGSVSRNSIESDSKKLLKSSSQIVPAGPKLVDHDFANNIRTKNNILLNEEYRYY